LIGCFWIARHQRRQTIGAFFRIIWHRIFAGELEPEFIEGSRWVVGFSGQKLGASNQREPDCEEKGEVAHKENPSRLMEVRSVEKDLRGLFQGSDFNRMEIRS
jgi:hypothetical protein